MKQRFLQMKPPFGTPVNTSHPLAIGLVGGWIMNENAGEELFDVSNNVNKGVLTGMTPVNSWVDANRGKGLRLDGNNEYILVGSSDFLSVTKQFSIVIIGASLDTRAGDPNKGLLCKGVVNDRNYLITTDVTNTNLLVGYEEEGGPNHFASGVATVPLNTFFDAGVTWDGSLVQPYFDGFPDGAGAAHSATPANNGSLAIGRTIWNDPLRSWDGIISTAYVYNRALSASEMLWLSRQPYAMFDRN